MDKKCYNCKYMDICHVYIQIVKLAIPLSLNMKISDFGESGYNVVINTIAHDCIQFDKLDNLKFNSPKIDKWRD